MLSSKEKENIQIVWDGMDAILKTKNEQQVETSFGSAFIQHNPWAQDGIEHVKEMLQFDFGYEPVRWVVDGDIMAYHGYYTAPNPLGEHPLLCVDAWRIEAGKIVEHWDALCPLPDAQLQKAIAGNGNGEKEVTDAIRQGNKATVKRFMDHVLNRGRIDQIQGLVDEGYVYHHEEQGELKGNTALIDHLAAQNQGKMPHDCKMLLASGDLVMAHAHFFGENERVVFDWFRLKDGKIAEHWSVAQAITPWEEVANEHPHF